MSVAPALLLGLIGSATSTRKRALVTRSTVVQKAALLSGGSQAKDVTFTSSNLYDDDFGLQTCVNHSALHRGPAARRHGTVGAAACHRCGRRLEPRW
jgi:hypothetical protein